MVKTYDFYEQIGIKDYQIMNIQKILSNIGKGIVTEQEIRDLGSEGLKYCLCEGKYDLFKKLVSPFAFKDKDGSKYYKYLLDAFSLGIVEFINNCPTSIMNAWATINENAKYSAEYEGREFFPVPVEYAAKYSLVLYPSLKEELLSAIYRVDKEKVMSIRIKDVLARQISGMGHPVTSKRDVIYYCEHTLLFVGLDLFSKNIITTANDTGGCYNDIVSDKETYVTNIIIDYESLDEQNKMVADQMVLEGNACYQENSYVGSGKGLIIEVLNKPTDTVSMVNAKLMELVSKFHKQDMLYGIATVEDIYEGMCRYFEFLSEEEQVLVNSILANGYTSENILEALKYFMYLDYYYDNEEDKFWISKYYYDKHRQYLEEQPNFGGQGLK